MKSYSRQTEITIVESQSAITTTQIVHELTQNDLKRTETWFAKQVRLEKAQRRHYSVMYTPQFDGLVGDCEC